MNEEIKNFIEKNIELIQYNKWEKIYSKKTPRGFTETLLNCGINPLKQGLDYIPKNFLYGSEIKEFTIPDNVTNIGDYTFYGCTSLTNIEIPNSVTSISDSVFYDCNLLQDIKYKGTVGEAKKIKFGYNWKYRAPVTKIICTDGVIEL